MGHDSKLVTRFPAVVTVARHLQLSESSKTGPIVAALNSRSAEETVSEEVSLRYVSPDPPVELTVQAPLVQVIVTPEPGVIVFVSILVM